MAKTDKTDSVKTVTEASESVFDAAGLQKCIADIKNELSVMNKNMGEVVNTPLNELVKKLTEKVNRLEILTNNSGLDKTIMTDAIGQVEKAVKALSANITDNISGDITLLNNNVEKNIDNLKRSVIDIFTRIQEMVSDEKSSGGSSNDHDLHENIEMLKTGMYNLNVNTEQRFSKLNKIIEETGIFARLQDFAEIKNLPALGELKNTLNVNLNSVADEFALAIVGAQNDDERNRLTRDFRKKVYDTILSMLSNVSEYVLTDTEDSNTPKPDYSAVRELRNSIDEIRSKMELSKDKESDLGEVVRECAKSIIENSEPDRLVIKELLADIKKNISVLQSGDEETDYTYSMQDIESDVAKIRIYLNELAQSGLSVDSEELTQEINNLVILVDSIKQQLNKIDECDIAETIGKIQDDMTSMSSRINKLLLTSDNAYNMVECTLKEFKLLSDEINNQIKALSGTNKFKSLEDSLTSVKNALVESNNYNSVINQSLIMLAEWVDNAGELLTNISEKQDKLNSVDDLTAMADNVKSSITDSSANVISSVRELLEDTNTNIKGLTPFDYSEVLNLISGKLAEQGALIEQQEERLNKLDEKLSTILEFVAKNDSSQLALSLTAIDEKMEKLNGNIEKITSFINED